MSVTAFGKITDRLGHALFVEHRKQGDAAAPFTHATACPSVSLRSVQPSRIPVDRNHSGTPLGEVVHLERDIGQNTWCVAVIDADAADLDGTGPWHWSMSIAARRAPGSLTYDDVMIEAVALVRNPAGIALPPLAFLDGDVRHGAHYTWPGNLVPSYLRHAVSACRGEYRSAATPLIIAGPHPTVEHVGAGLVLRYGEPVVNRASSTPPPQAQPDAAPVRVTRVGRRDYFVIDAPPPRRSPSRKPKVMWQGTIAGSLSDALPGGGLAFKASDTEAGREAAALCADQVIDGAVARRLADGSWSTLQLVVT